MESCNRDLRYAAAVKLAEENGLTMRKLVFEDTPGEIAVYRLSGSKWYKDIYPAKKRIHCPERSRQGPFIAMSRKSDWTLLDVVKVCVKAINKMDRQQQPVRAYTQSCVQPDYEWFPEDNRKALLEMLERLAKTESTDGTPDYWMAFSGMLADMMHLGEYKKFDFKAAIEEATNMYSEDKEDSEFSLFGTQDQVSD